MSRRPLVHGTYSGYCRGCHCEECRAAKVAYRRSFYEVKVTPGRGVRWLNGITVDALLEWAWGVEARRSTR